MKKKTLIRVLFLSLGSSILLWIVTLFMIRAFNENSNIELRRHMALTLASAFETEAYPQAIEKIQKPRAGRPGFRAKVWVVGPSGQVLASTSPKEASPLWSSLSKPDKVHDIELGYFWFALNPSYTVIRLAAAEPTYLVYSTQREGHAAQRNFIQFILFGSALALSTLISFFITFYYLRKKSREARAVIRRLEQGDLKARFQIKQFDEIGNLMLDFNRMASEIERLVGKLKETEEARRVLFHELSHDLRTPMTSLRTSIDMLSSHWDEIAPQDRKEVLSICQIEISYFVELLENLLFIAQMEEPKYKATRAIVDVASIINVEVKAMASASSLKWNSSVPTGPAKVAGDPHQIQRLIRNALENAARYATREVTIQLKHQDSSLVLEILDDGPGMSPEEIAQFGKSRGRRLTEGPTRTHLSLGLGSVIMRKITELHQGTLVVKTRENPPSGTCLEISFPRAA
jgi:signal transduction histidine kinase